MRLIDADKLRKDVIDLPDLYNGFSDTYDKAYILDLVDEQPTVEAEPTEEQVKEYCRKRCLVVVSSELFNEMKARWGRDNTKHGHWISACQTKFDKLFFPQMFKCSVCGNYLDFDGINAGRGDTNYCPHCGAKMDGERREDETD